MGTRARRVRWWHIAVVMALALVGAGTLYVVKLMTLQPGTSVDYAQLLYEHVEANQERGENAWQDYADLLEGHAKLKEGVRAEAPELEHYVHPDYTAVFSSWLPGQRMTGDELVDDLNAEEAAVTEREREVAREWVRTALSRFPEAGLDAHLDRLVELRRMVRPKAEDSILLVKLMPDLGASRDTARALRARMRVSMEQGDEAAFVMDAERLLALSRHVGAQGTLIESLVGLAMRSLVMEEIAHHAVGGKLSPTTCRALLAAIDRQAPRPPVSYSVECERLQMLDLLQSLHSDDGNGNGTRIYTRANEFAGKPPGPRVLNVLGVLYPSKKQMVEQVGVIYDGLAKAADTPRREDRSKVFDYEAHASSLGPGYEMLTVMGSAYDKAFAAHDQSMMTAAGVRILLAIELVRLERGTLPASLDELVPGILPSLPEDPYAADGRFCFRVLEQPDAKGRTYLLYSVGADQADNAGTPAASRYDALRQTGAGTDFIINDVE